MLFAKIQWPVGPTLSPVGEKMHPAQGFVRSLVKKANPCTSRTYSPQTFVRYLEIIGVGYKAAMNPETNILNLKLGFSHDINLKVPPCIRVFCIKPTLICCVGTDIQSVSQFVAIVKSFKPPSPYKGKGIRYRNEVIVLKQGKKK